VGGRVTGGGDGELVLDAGLRSEGPPQAVAVHVITVPCVATRAPLAGSVA
jgi:hypothetical protein